jgi:hypothetical protein
VTQQKPETGQKPATKNIKNKQGSYGALFVFYVNLVNALKTVKLPESMFFE